jgi:hypothetical protein
MCRDARQSADDSGHCNAVNVENGCHPRISAIRAGSKNKTFRMQHYDRDTLIYATEGENDVGRSGITFTIGPEGKAAQVVVENLNVRGEGTFKRVPAEK